MSKPHSPMLLSPIGTGHLTCASCGVVTPFYVLGRGRKAIKEAIVVAGFNKVKGRGWLCFACEFPN